MGDPMVGEVSSCEHHAGTGRSDELIWSRWDAGYCNLQHQAERL